MQAHGYGDDAPVEPNDEATDPLPVLHATHGMYLPAMTAMLLREVGTDRYDFTLSANNQSHAQNQASTALTRYSEGGWNVGCLYWLVGWTCMMWHGCVMVGA